MGSVLAHAFTFLHKNTFPVVSGLGFLCCSSIVVLPARGEAKSTIPYKYRSVIAYPGLSERRWGGSWSAHIGTAPIRVTSMRHNKEHRRKSALIISTSLHPGNDAAIGTRHRIFNTTSIIIDLLLLLFSWQFWNILLNFEYVIVHIN